MKLENKNVLVFGSGISGIGAANLLAEVGAKPIIYDENENRAVDEILSKVKHPDVTEVYIGRLTQERFDTLDLVVMSPGVPTDIPLVELFRAAGIPVWGEIELAYQIG